MAEVRYTAASCQIGDASAFVFVDYDDANLKILRVGVSNDLGSQLKVSVEVRRGAQSLLAEVVVAPGVSTWQVPGNHTMLNEPHHDGGPTIRPPLDFSVAFEVV